MTFIFPHLVVLYVIWLKARCISQNTSVSYWNNSTIHPSLDTSLGFQEMVTEQTNATADPKERSPSNTDHVTERNDTSTNNVSEYVSTQETLFRDFERQQYGKVEFALRGVIIPTVCILGMTGDLVILKVLYNGIHTNSAPYLVGITASDLIFLVAFFPDIFAAYSSVRDTNWWETFYPFYVCYFFNLVFICHSIGVFTTFCFTIERLIVIRYPMKAHTICTPFRAKIAVISSCLLALALHITRFFRLKVVSMTSASTNETYYSYALTEMGQNPVYTDFFVWSSFVMNLAIPFPVLALLNTTILILLRAARNKRKHLTLSGDKPSVDRHISRDNQITRLLIAVVVAFLIGNTLSALSTIFHATHGLLSIESAIHRWYINLFGNLTIAVNPLANVMLYAFYSHSIRQAILKMICKTPKPESDARDIPQLAASQLAA